MCLLSVPCCLSLPVLCLRNASVFCLSAGTTPQTFTATVRRSRRRPHEPLSQSLQNVGTDRNPSGCWRGPKGTVAEGGGSRDPFLSVSFLLHLRVVLSLLCLPVVLRNPRPAFPLVFVGLLLLFRVCILLSLRGDTCLFGAEAAAPPAASFFPSLSSCCCKPHLPGPGRLFLFPPQQQQKQQEPQGPAQQQQQRQYTAAPAPQHLLQPASRKEGQRGQRQKPPQQKQAAPRFR